MADNEIYYGRGGVVLGPYHPDEVALKTEETWQREFDALTRASQGPIFRIEAPDLPAAKRRLAWAIEKDAKAKR